VLGALMLKAKKCLVVSLFLLFMISLSSNSYALDDYNLPFLQKIADKLMEDEIDVDSPYQNVIDDKYVKGSNNWPGGEKIIEQDGTSLLFSRKDILNDAGEKTGYYAIATTDSNRVDYINTYKDNKFWFDKLVVEETVVKEKVDDNKINLQIFSDYKNEGAKTKENKLLEYSDMYITPNVINHEITKWNKNKPEEISVFNEKIGNVLYVNKEDNYVYYNSKDANQNEEITFFNFDENKNLEKIYATKLDDKGEPLYSVDFNIDYNGLVHTPEYSKDAPKELNVYEQKEIKERLSQWKQEDFNKINKDFASEVREDTISSYISDLKEEQNILADFYNKNEEEFANMQKPNVPFITSKDEIFIANNAVSILTNDMFEQVENNILNENYQPKDRNAIFIPTNVKENLLSIKTGGEKSDSPAFSSLLEKDGYAESPVANQYGQKVVWESNVVEENGKKKVFLTESILDNSDNILKSTTSILEDGKEVGTNLITYDDKGYKEYQIESQDNTYVFRKKQYEYKEKQYDYSTEIEETNNKLFDVNKKLEELKNKDVYDDEGNKLDISVGETQSLISEKTKLLNQKTELESWNGKGYMDVEEKAYSDFNFDKDYNIFRSEVKKENGDMIYSDYDTDATLKEEITTRKEDGFDVLNIRRFKDDSYEFVESKVSEEGSYSEKKEVWDNSIPGVSNLIETEKKEYQYDDEGKISKSLINTQFLDSEGKVVKEVNDEFVRNDDGTKNQYQTEVSDDGYVSKVLEYDWEGDFPKKVVVKKVSDDFQATTIANIDPITGETILLESDRDSDGNIDASYLADKTGVLKSVEDKSQEFLPKDLVKDGYIIEPYYGFVENPTGMKNVQRTSEPFSSFNRLTPDDVQETITPRDFDKELTDLNSQIAEKKQDLEDIKIYQRDKYILHDEPHKTSDLTYDLRYVETEIKDLETQKKLIQIQKEQSQTDKLKPDDNFKTIFDDPTIKKNIDKTNPDVVYDKETGEVKVLPTESQLGLNNPDALNTGDEKYIPLGKNDVDSLFDENPEKIPVYYTDGSLSHYKTEYGDGSTLREFPDETSYLSRTDKNGFTKEIETLPNGETTIYYTDVNGGQKIVTDDLTVYVANDGTETYFDKDGNEIIPEEEISRKPIARESVEQLETDKSLGETPRNDINPNYQVEVKFDENGNMYVPIEDPNVIYNSDLPSDTTGLDPQTKIIVGDDGKIYAELNPDTTKGTSTPTQDTKTTTGTTPTQSSANQPTESSSGYTPTLQGPSSQPTSSGGGISWTNSDEPRDVKYLYKHLANFFVYLFKGDVGMAFQELVYALPLIGIFLLVFVVMKYISEITIFRHFGGRP
jgi:hypothetical protein